jgi:hypothetical protein
MMFWNSWIKFLNETYLFLGVCVALNLGWFFKFDTFGNALNSLISVFFGSLLLIFPFFIPAFYGASKFARKIKTKDEEFLERFGSVLEGLDFERKGQIVLLYPSVTMIRKLWLIVTVVFMQGMPIFSIFAVNFQAHVMLVIVGYLWPFRSNVANKMGLFNEVCVLLTNYHLFLFTDFLPNPDLREKIGLSLIVVTCMSILVNLGTVTISILAAIIRKLKLSLL